MSYSIEHRKDIPCVIGTLSGDITMAEYAMFGKERHEIFKQATQPMYYIAISEMEMDIDTVVKTANALARGQYGLRDNPNFKGMVMVTDNCSVAVAAKELSCRIFGNICVEILENIEAAIRFVTENT